MRIFFCAKSINDVDYNQIKCSFISKFMQVDYVHLKCQILDLDPNTDLMGSSQLYKCKTVICETTVQTVLSDDCLLISVSRV